METKKTIKNKFDIAIQCLACYNQGRLTFYWKSIDKNTTLEDIQKSLEVETIHAKAKVKYLCGGDEYFISDTEEISIEEYSSSEEIHQLAQALADVEDVDMIKAYKRINYSLDLDSSDWTEFKDNVLVFNYLSDAEDYAEEHVKEVYDFYSIEDNFFVDWINWDSLKEYILDTWFWCVEIPLGYQDKDSYNTSRYFVWSR
jgi:hypothetical protein